MIIETWLLLKICFCDTCVKVFKVHLLRYPSFFFIRFKYLENTSLLEIAYLYSLVANGKCVVANGKCAVANG